MVLVDLVGADAKTLHPHVLNNQNRVLVVYSTRIKIRNPKKQ